MRRLSVIVPGVLWGLGAVLLIGAGTNIARGMAGSSPAYASPQSFIVAGIRALFGPQHSPFGLLGLPFVFGMDLLIWTVGVLLWLPMRQGWPGTALFAFFGRHERLGTAMITVSTALGGIGLVWLLAWLLSLIPRVLTGGRSP